MIVAFAQTPVKHKTPRSSQPPKKVKIVNKPKKTKTNKGASIEVIDFDSEDESIDNESDF